MSEETDIPREENPEPLDFSPPTQISAAIDKILANPELISMVASALGGTDSAKKDAVPNTVTTSAESDTGIENKAVDEKSGDILATLAPILSSLQGRSILHHSQANDKRACLLNALKPYLCQERCEAIDYMIKLSKISELLKNIT